MLSPPVWRGADRQRAILGRYTAAAILGGILSAACLWFLAGLVRWLPGTAVVMVLGLLCFLAVTIDLRLLPFSLPQNRRQIPRTLFHAGTRRAAVQFGFEMGTGVRTYLPSSAPYVAAGALVLLVDSLPSAALMGVGFGLARGLIPWFRHLSVEPQQWEDRLNETLRWGVPVSTIACSIFLVASAAS
jgi:hypothetical protein